MFKSSMTIKCKQTINDKESNLYGIQKGYILEVSNEQGPYLICSLCEWNGLQLSKKEILEYFKIL